MDGFDGRKLLTFLGIMALLLFSMQITSFFSGKVSRLFSHQQRCRYRIEAVTPDHRHNHMEMWRHRDFDSMPRRHDRRHHLIPRNYSERPPIVQIYPEGVQ